MSPDSSSSTRSRATRDARHDDIGRRAPSSRQGAVGPDHQIPPRTNGASIPDLIRELSSEGADLVRQEVALVRAEMNEKVDHFQRNLTSIALGSAMLLAALLTGLWAVNRGLTALLGQFVSVEIAIWLSPLILTVLLGGIGWAMVSKGKKGIADEGLTPDKTTETIKEDTRWARSKVRAMTEEIRHG